MAFKPIDNKRDQFRKYLETSGVIEVLSKSITKLMESPEKPDSPVEFIRENMGRSRKEINEIEFLKEEVEVYKKQVNELKMEIAGLKLERQEVESTLPKEVIVPDTTVNDDIVSENQNDKQNEEETKVTESVEPTPVLAKITDDVQKVDNANDVKADISSVVEAADVKIEPKTDDIKTDDKTAPAVSVAVEAPSEPTDK